VFDVLADFPSRPGKNSTLTVEKTSLCEDGWIDLAEVDFWPWETLMGLHGISVSNPCVDVANGFGARDGVDGVIVDGKETLEPISPISKS